MFKSPPTPPTEEPVALYAGGQFRATPYRNASNVSSCHVGMCCGRFGDIHLNNYPVSHTHTHTHSLIALRVLFASVGGLSDAVKCLVQWLRKSSQ